MKRSTATATMASVSPLPKRARARVRGVSSSVVLRRSAEMRPSSVAPPVATTTPSPVP